uniref:TBC1 domain family member 23 n=1 Tax=Macrostomum lignano TaxID=282301 RepID=A0A1I8H9N0_9PLAT
MTEPESASANQSQSELINEEDPDACLEHDSFGAEQIAAATELSGFEDDGEADEDLFEELERLRESGFATVDEDDADDGGGGLGGGSETAWRIDLETALLDDECDFGTVRNICRGRAVPGHLRAQVWSICLGAASGGARAASLLDEFDGLFDLPEQAELRAACRDFVRDWDAGGGEGGVAMQSDLESMLTHYCKLTGRKFLSVVRALLQLPQQPPQQQQPSTRALFPMFSALLTKYTPRPEPACHVFRLLLQYHEPALSSLLDSLRLPVADFASDWMAGLLARDLATEVLHPLWDMYFLLADPFLLLFISLVFVVNCKESLLAPDVDAESVRRMLSTTPSALGVADVADLCTLAQHYACRTPASLRTLFTAALFGDAEPDADLLMALCLPVTVAEVTRDPPFTLVDVRSPDMYNRGHLAGAYNLDSGLLLSRPTEFDSALAAVVRTANGPLCVSGHGRKEEDTTTVLVAAQLLRRLCPGVSIFPGEDDEEDETEELVSVSTWQRDALSSYPCSLLLGDDNQQTPGHLIIREQHMYLLRLCPKQPGMAAIVVRRPLVKVVKITSKKRLPEFITFKYGDTDKDGVTHLTDMDRVVIPKAGEATKDVKMQIIKLLGGVSPQQ